MSSNLPDKVKGVMLRNFRHPWSGRDPGREAAAADDLPQVIPDIRVTDRDLLPYALEHAMVDVKLYLMVGSADALPYFRPRHLHQNGSQSGAGPNHRRNEAGGSRLQVSSSELLSK